MGERNSLYDLPDYLMQRATSFDEPQIFDSLTCKLAYIPKGADPTKFEIGWQRSRSAKIGLKEDLTRTDLNANVLSAGERVEYL